MHGMARHFACRGESVGAAEQLAVQAYSTAPKIGATLNQQGTDDQRGSNGAAGKAGAAVAAAAGAGKDATETGAGGKGKDGGQGDNGKKAGEDGATGANGTDGASGGDAQPITVEMSGSSSELILNGTMGEKFLPISPNMIVAVVARGGDGGDGGSGGDGGVGGVGQTGGAGGKGARGEDAKEYAKDGCAGGKGGDGGCGWTGGSGGTGGKGGKAGSGGNGAAVQISVASAADAHLLAYLVADARRGNAGRRGVGGGAGKAGRGGDGGAAGRGGLGGAPVPSPAAAGGAPAGAPGVAASSTPRSDAARAAGAGGGGGKAGPSGAAGANGKKGNDGRDGKRGGDGAEGEAGAAGAVTYVVGGESSERLFSIDVISFSVRRLATAPYAPMTTAPHAPMRRAETRRADATRPRRPPPQSCARPFLAPDGRSLMPNSRPRHRANPHLTSHLSPLTSHLSPLTSHLSPGAGGRVDAAGRLRAGLAGGRRVDRRWQPRRPRAARRRQAASLELRKLQPAHHHGLRGARRRRGLAAAARGRWRVVGPGAIDAAAAAAGDTEGRPGDAGGVVRADDRGDAGRPAADRALPPALRLLAGRLHGGKVVWLRIPPPVD